MSWVDGDTSSDPPRRAPSCPTCGCNDDIERLNRAIDGREFWCATCSTVFSGRSGEWERNASRRNRYQSGFYDYRPLRPVGRSAPRESDVAEEVPADG